VTLAQSSVSNPVRPLFITNTAATGNIGQGAQLSFGNDVGSSAPSPSGFVKTVNRNAVSQASAMVFGGFNGAGQQEHVFIEPDGQVRKPFQAAFYAFNGNSDNQLTGTTGAVQFNAVKFNTASGFNTGNGRFTAPFAGVYWFGFSIQHNANNATGTVADLFLNGGVYAKTRGELFGTANYYIVTASACVYMNANDYVTVNSNDVHNNYTPVSGYFLG
jgi:hypothetical protein